MVTVLQYGTEQSVHLDSENGTLVGAFGRPRASALSDPAAATHAALAEPLDYPSLAKCITPSDRVVLALDEGVPQAEPIVAAVVAHLLTAGIDLDGISILQAPSDSETAADDLRRAWPSDWRERIHMLAHDPNDRHQIAYLATTEAGETVFLNRALTDADFVIPIGCVRREAAPGYRGIHGSLFPAFSTQQTILRYRAPDLLQARGKEKQRQLHEIDEVGWLLGVTFTVQVVPAGGDQVLNVLAGQPASVRARGRELYRAAWVDHVPHRASLVVAAIEGGASQQTWQNLGRALAAAVPLVEADGAIVICSDLTATPGQAVRYLAEIDSRPTALRVIRKARPADTLSALQLARAQERTTVYLLSRLDAALVEQLEMSPLDEAEEVSRLVRRHRSCIVLANAPHVTVKVEHKD